MEELKLELKKMIIETLSLDDVTHDEIIDDEPLFITGLGLDSIDALELTVALEFNYGIKIEDADEGKKVFASVNALAKHVSENRKK